MPGFDREYELAKGWTIGLKWVGRRTWEVALVSPDRKKVAPLGRHPEGFWADWAKDPAFLEAVAKELQVSAEEAAEALKRAYQEICVQGIKRPAQAREPMEGEGKKTFKIHLDGDRILTAWKERGLYRICALSLQGEEVVWQDAQGVPFWASERSKERTFKSLQKCISTLTPERFEEIAKSFASAELRGEIPEETARKESKEAQEEGTGDAEPRPVTARDELGNPIPQEELDARAMAFLRDPALLHRVKVVLERGFVKGDTVKTYCFVLGEDDRKLLTFVIFVSAATPWPQNLWVTGDPGFGKTNLAMAAAGLMPPGFVKRRAYLTPAGLRYGDQDYRVLFIEEWREGMEQDARLMWKGDGGYIYEIARKNPETGEMETQIGEIPARSIVTTSAERLPGLQMLRRTWLLSVSEDPELTKMINLRKAEYAAGKVQPAPEVEVAVVQRAIQLLQEADVVVPYAEELVELAPWDRTRLDFLLDIIRVIAWLHQYRRGRDEAGRIVATPADLYMAARIAWPTLAQTLVQLPDRLKKVLEKLPPSTEKRGATTKELASELKISQSSVRVYLSDLYNLGYALIGRQDDGRGKVYWRSDKSAEVLHSANEVIKHLNWQKIAEIAKRSLIQASSPSVTSEGGVDPMVCVVDPLEGTTHHILPPPPQNVTLPEEGEKEEILGKGAEKEEFERYPQGVASGSTSASTPPLGGGASPGPTRQLVVREKFYTPTYPPLKDLLGERWLEPGEVIEVPERMAEDLLSAWSRCFAPAPEGGKKVPPSEEDLVPINPLKEIPGREGEVVDLQGGRLVRVPLVPGRPAWVSPKTAESLVKGGYAEYVEPPDGGGREDAGGS